MSTLKKLQTFVTVAECKKMSTAAQKLYISQPTVSQIISDLEKEYNIELFERSSKELRITPAGELLLINAREIILLHDKLVNSMKSIRSIRPLKIGATLTIGDVLMGEIAKALKERCPDLDLRVLVTNTQNLEYHLLKKEIDIALVEGSIHRQDIVSEPVISDELFLFCGPTHPFACANHLSPAQLINQEFVLRERGSGTRSIFEQIMHAHNLPFITKWECSSAASVIDAVHHGHGIGVLSYRSIEPYLSDRHLILCPVKNFSMKRSFSVCYNVNHIFTSQMQDFMNEVQNSKYRKKKPDFPSS